MSRDADPKLTRLFDKRTVERNIKKGLVSRKDYEKYLKSLDDVTGKGAYGAAEVRDDDDDDDEQDDVSDAAETAAPDGTSGDNQPG